MKKVKIKFDHFAIRMSFHIYTYMYEYLYIYMNHIIIYIYIYITSMYYLLLIILVARYADSSYKLHSNEENKILYDSHVTYIRTSIRNISRRAVNK